MATKFNSKLTKEKLQELKEQLIQFKKDNPDKDSGKYKIGVSSFTSLIADLENDLRLLPAIPPQDYKGSQADWMTKLQERDLWDGEGWHGDVQICSADWWEILEECEGTEET